MASRAAADAHLLHDVGQVGEMILKERRLKLARFGELNDPFELSLIDSRRRDTRRW
jgi:hypothetical protein